MSEKRGIRVEDECVDFYKKIVSFTSEFYRYEYKNGQLVVHYDVRRGLKRENVPKKRIEVRSQKRSYARFNSLMAFAAVLLLALACVLARFEMENGSFEFLTAADEVSQIDS